MLWMLWSTSDLGCFGARVDDCKGKLARFFVSGQCGSNAVNSARRSGDGIFYSCKRGFLLVVRLIGSLSVILGSQGEISS